MFAMENLGRPAGLVVGPFFVGAVAGWAGGVEGWRWAMFAVAIPALHRRDRPALHARTRARSQRAGGDPRAAPRHLGGSAGSPQRGGGAPAQGQELPLPDPRDRRARVRARERAGAPQLPPRRDVPLRRVQARLGALAHLPSRAARDPVRGPDGRPAVPPRPAERGAHLRRARHRVRRLPHDRLPARARSNRFIVLVAIANACQLAAFTQVGPDDLGGGPVPHAARRRSRSSASTSSCSAVSSAGSRSRRSPTTTASAPRSSSSSRRRR